ncbi:MAG: cell wall hydrolase [Clostridiales bacterium]|uniref:cell wall hydrolase n=1 Tax=Evtepia sp. TaxID=2773933 RepID=UPI002985958B|nr:cell wall hydrolase [Evtepia sp.]MDD7288905.1 cell wall hydrolase [Clostridiales bacterium]MDY3992559.1 cell wall hydrolase [Evtepia sp.]MDY4430759.1 cell wall hydrolase [Evtepia sp.]
MKKHLPSAMVLFALLLVLCLHAFAADNPSDSGRYTPASSGSGYLFTSAQTSTRAKLPPALGEAGTLEALRTTPDITVNGISIGCMTPRCAVDGTVYVAVSPILQTLFPDASLTFQDGCLIAAGDTLCLQAREGNTYFQVNQRYLYVPSLVVIQEGQLMLPAGTLAEALGCSLRGDGVETDLVFRQVSPVIQAGTYDENDLYWLSRAIYAEAGNQPMQGRLAVGTVILNRVADPQFPNTVEEVIFEPGQFSPVSNGTIYREPDEDSLVAARLCLDGVREAGDCLYFNVTSLYSWADRARTYYCTIGGHNFYL